MRRHWTHYSLTLGFLLGATANVFGQDPTFTTIDFPGATSTAPWSINTHGDIADVRTAITLLTTEAA
jgi:hypothetical protein